MNINDNRSYLLLFCICHRVNMTSNNVQYLLTLLLSLCPISLFIARTLGFHCRMTFLDGLVKCSTSDLQRYTDNFCQENFIGEFQFGKVYRGVIQQDNGQLFVMVKIWEPSNKYHYVEGDNEERLADEIMLLQHQQINFHRDLVKLYGYCSDSENLGLVYKLKPWKTVLSLLPTVSFSWTERIKVALRLARLLKFFHGENPMKLPFVIHNLCAEHIILDEECNPKLFDFSLISGGIFPDRICSDYDHRNLNGCYGYIDPVFSYLANCDRDLFAFGVLLLMLITKKTHAEYKNHGGYFVYIMAETQNISRESASPEFRSLVHESLKEDKAYCSSDGLRITKLALRCVQQDPWKRPSVKQIIKCLENLHVLRPESGRLSMIKMLCWKSQLH